MNGVVWEQKNRTIIYIASENRPGKIEVYRFGRDENGHQGRELLSETITEDQR